ncbi:response regulator transcription factor [Agromyces seonyuensis]|uniref:DNA-binding response regulator n=1 Tax=Agromyces seonyuensis TaxID=2662446 RepID=A0A6I4NZ87_9MICO|nr:response regulator transcription factor [Agromyces seonyuensis]MWB99623.1 DNA-binding response regulator [Agromyces seonyuensis]
MADVRAVPTAEAPLAGLRAAVADASLLERRGIADILVDAGADVAGEPATVEDLLSLLAAERFDVAVVAAGLPGFAPIAERICVDDHTADAETRPAVIVLGDEAALGPLVRHPGGPPDGTGLLLSEGVRRPGALVDAVTRVVAGEALIDGALVASFVRHPAGPLDALTRREREVLALLAEGWTNRAIARRTMLSERTVESHVSSILSKLALDDHPDRHRRVLAAIASLRA